jgi:PleD family two-component response regulator
MKLIDKKTALSAQETFADAEPIIDVLLIDDQAIVAEGIRPALEAEGFRFHYCASARKALSVAGALRPTVILLDLLMPEVDGLVLLRYLRAHPATAHVPVIVLSGRDDAEAKTEAAESGAAEYMIKFPKGSELCARIRHHARANRESLANARRAS